MLDLEPTPKLAKSIVNVDLFNDSPVLVFASSELVLDYSRVLSSVGVKALLDLARGALRVV